VRDGKGGKDRLTVLPQSLVPELQKHLLRKLQQQNNLTQIKIALKALASF
jgi:hypothetical protein